MVSPIIIRGTVLSDFVKVAAEEASEASASRSVTEIPEGNFFLVLSIISYFFT
jgi:hypothetical protein